MDKRKMAIYLVGLGVLLVMGLGLIFSQIWDVPIWSSWFKVIEVIMGGLQ